MEFQETLKLITPEPIRAIMRPIRNRLINKYDGELSFWKGRFKADNGCFSNSHYERIMLAIAGEENQDFLKGKVIADFGCGPRGSLAWINDAQIKIGIDVLAHRYADEFTESILSHNMCYLKSTEKVIPLPSGLVDVMFTVNAIDHVDNFSNMCDEIIRVLKPGGVLVASFNLGEPATPYEPQNLTEDIVKENLLNKLDIQTYRVTNQDSPDDTYAPFLDGRDLCYDANKEGLLWVRAKKRLQ